MVDFVEELSKNRKKISLNFFAECHGKNPLDAHFSNIAEMINRESESSQSLNCSKDIVDTINKKQAKINEYRVGKGNILNFL